MERDVSIWFCGYKPLQHITELCTPMTDFPSSVFTNIRPCQQMFLLKVISVSYSILWLYPNVFNQSPASYCLTFTFINNTVINTSECNHYIHSYLKEISMPTIYQLGKMNGKRQIARRLVSLATFNGD